MSVELILPSLNDGEDKNSPFANCLRNQYRHLRKWAKRISTDCFRIYDRQLHHFPLAIDLYAGRFCIHYYSPSKDNPDPSEELISTTEQTLKNVFNLDSPAFYWRIRKKSKKERQYEKQADTKNFFVAHEYGAKFLINLEDYLDTGLFLDHRETRHLVSQNCAGKKMLNLFAYTCSFTVHAALAGATHTKSVDMSNTYTDWGKHNLLLNHISLKNHEIIRADCSKFLKEEINLREKYDLIVIDPPTISRSKKMDRLFDLQQDYVWLIEQSLQLLNKNGKIYFSTNSQKFHFDTSLFNCSIQELTHKTHAPDFKSPTKTWALGDSVPKPLPKSQRPSGHR